MDTNKIAAEAEVLLSYLEDRGLTESEACDVMEMALQALRGELNMRKPETEEK